MPILIIIKNKKNPPLGLQKKKTQHPATKHAIAVLKSVLLVAAAATVVMLFLAGRSGEGMLLGV